MRWTKLIFFLATALIAVLCSLNISNASPGQQLSVYAAQNSYSLPVLDRGGQPYISVADLLLPLGATPAHGKGKERRFTVNNAEARLTEGKEKAVVRGDQISLGGKVLFEQDQTLIPLNAVLPLLGRLLNTTIDFHQPSRRLFVGNAITHYHAEYKEGERPSLTLTFSQPVNPEIKQEQGHTVFVFQKDPVISDQNQQQFGGNSIQSLKFAEENGAASISIAGNTTFAVTRSEDGRTIVVQPEIPVTAAAQPAPETKSTPLENQRHGQEFFVMIDPGHGGYDKGASFGGKLTEKDVTLHMARELKKELEEHGIAARLLRDSDVDMALDRRAEATNEQHAGLYVALHAGYPGRGVRVYMPLLSNAEQPASGRFLSWENAQSSTLDRSKFAAQAVTAELQKKGLTVTNLSATLRPLNNIVAPAIAVELAPDGDDIQSLESQKRQNLVSSAIALGIAQARSQIGARP